MGEEGLPFIFGLHKCEKVPSMSITGSLLKLGVISN